MHINLNIKQVWLNDKAEKKSNQIPFSGTILRNQSLKKKKSFSPSEIWV